MSKNCGKDVFGEYILSAATLGISSVIGIWKDMQEQQESAQPQTAQPAAPTPA